MKSTTSIIRNYSISFTLCVVTVIILSGTKFGVKLRGRQLQEQLQQQ